MSRVLETRTPPAGGLRRRVLALQAGAGRPPASAPRADAPDPPPTAEVKRAEPPAPELTLRPEDAVRRLLRGMPDLPAGLQLPSHLFGLLASNLHLQKASLLLPDYDDDQLVPWAHTGIDQTTLRRLRVSETELDRSAASAGAVIRGDDLAALLPFFSRREASMLEQLLVFPIRDDEGLLALLLVSECAYLPHAEQPLLLILAAVGEAAAGVLRAHRDRCTSLIRQSIVFRPDEIATVADRFADHLQGSVRILLIDCGDFVSQVTATGPFLDPHRVWQDLLRTTATLLSATATVCDGGSQRALLFVHAEVGDDPELVVHQLAVTLAHLLPELGGVPALRWNARSYPADGGDLSLLAHEML